MTNSQLTITSTDSTYQQPTISAGERRQRWFELCLVLLVAFGGKVFSVLYFLKYGPNPALLSANSRWASGFVQQITALLLLGYVLSRRKLRFANLGLRWSISDAAVGLLVTAACMAAYRFGDTWVQAIHHQMYGSWVTSPTGNDFFAHPPLAAIPYFLLNPFFEELIVRAYLMTEVMELTGSAVLAIALSVSVQFSYHLYYGWAGAISLSFLFLVLALYYMRSRRALPIIVAHGFLDVLALIRLW